MPKFSGKVVNNQIIFSVFCAPTQDELQKILQNSVPSEPFRALIDTGATGSVISSNVAQKLNLSPTGMTNVISATEIKPMNIYRLFLGIPVDRLSSPSEIQRNAKLFGLSVTEMPALANNFDILIGMDVIQDCLLFVNGDMFTFAI